MTASSIVSISRVDRVDITVTLRKLTGDGREM